MVACLSSQPGTIPIDCGVIQRNGVFDYVDRRMTDIPSIATASGQVVPHLFGFVAGIKGDVFVNALHLTRVNFASFLVGVTIWTDGKH